MKTILGLLVGMAILPRVVSAESDSPEAVIRSFVLAMYANDVTTYERLSRGVAFGPTRTEIIPSVRPCASAPRIDTDVVSLVGRPVSRRACSQD
jgi:hypothetical protein